MQIVAWRGYETRPEGSPSGHRLPSLGDTLGKTPPEPHTQEVAPYKLALQGHHKERH